MTVHLYVSLIPEALIASMLSPEEFGVYYAVGGEKKARGQAMFFEIDPDYRHEFFNIDDGVKRCIPHEDGTPKASIYISIYRVLEHIDPNAIKKLYLVTSDGRTLGIDPAEKLPEDSLGLHLYQEIAPVNPLVVSTYGPHKFYELIVKNMTLIQLPAICFAELRLGALATDPEDGEVGDLPYANIDHLRECLIDLRSKTIFAKMVDRTHSPVIMYRTVKSGFYFACKDTLLYFPMPSTKELREKHNPWRRSANM
jgi:hypothetical protein